MKTLQLTDSTNPSSVRIGFILVGVLACIALLPAAQATDLDGVLPNGNTADGSGVLVSLTTGGHNSGFGFQALNHDTSGVANTAAGYQALFSNTTGSLNTAIGVEALLNNTTGGQNTATGVDALVNNASGAGNTANGFSALGGNTTGIENTAIGDNALGTNDTGEFNTAIGDFALPFNTTGSHNIALGSGAGGNLTTGDNNIDIGNIGVAAEGNTIRIGTQGTQTATYIAGISGTALGAGVAVRVNANGQLGTAPSSARFKQNIKPMNKASEAIHALKPVVFRYKKEFDPDGTAQFGLVAEDVEKVNPDLVARDASGKPYTVRYDAVNVMLLNEFLKEHQTVQELKSTVAKEEATIAEQQKQIQTLATGLQRVSDQLELNKPAPQVVDNK